MPVPTWRIEILLTIILVLTKHFLTSKHYIDAICTFFGYPMFLIKNHQSAAVVSLVANLHQIQWTQGYPLDTGRN